ncbi:Low-density lipoprotein receptor-related protein 5 (LRP-5) (Low-density lipoprotein receptor-related protein 7) (LRP-7) [Durusdinium trenchii]|uniref:Low-density lipoprotein receptor-related protein 5 (LRP-5) (Low-density lipoprotein receptor-related protein 7) (LRP-7) n=1 Tax=Durusdinium trenchii TaxID=1381693 RepID=A0ABP0HM80_9DINO
MAKLFWIDVSLKKIQRANIDGSCVEDVATDLARPSGLALDPSGRVVWSDLEERRIYRCGQDGGDVEVLAEGLQAPTGSSLASDGRRTLWADLSLRQICFVEDASREPKALASELHSPNCVALSTTGDVYWGDFGTRKIHVKRGTQKPEVLVPYGKNSSSLVVDTARRKLFWTNFGTNAIYRCDLEGKEMQPLITDLHSPSALALAPNAGKLFWLERASGKLWRATVEGTHVEELLHDLPDPWALAVWDEAPAALVAIEKYSWADEGAIVKVYISASSNPCALAARGEECLEVDFQARGFTLTVRPGNGPDFQLKARGLLQEVVPEKCKVRLSTGKRITLSLAKKDPLVTWSALSNRNW